MRFTKLVNKEAEWMFSKTFRVILPWRYITVEELTSQSTVEVIEINETTRCRGGDVDIKSCSYDLFLSVSCMHDFSHVLIRTLSLSFWK